MRLFLPDDTSRPLFRHRPGGFLLLRPSRRLIPFRPVTGRVTADGVELTAGPPTTVAVLVVLVLVLFAGSWVGGLLATVRGDWGNGVVAVLMAPLAVSAILDGRRDAERLTRFVAETLDAR